MSPSLSSSAPRAYILKVQFNRKYQYQDLAYFNLTYKLTKSPSFNAPALRSATVLDVSTIGINPCSGTLLDIYVAPYDASKSGVRCPANSTTSSDPTSSSDSTGSSDSPSSSDSTPVPETSHHPALQPGAIAGIVVGCVVGVGLVGAGIFVLRKRRTQAKKQNAAVSAVSPGEGGDDDAPPPYSRNPAS